MSCSVAKKHKRIVCQLDFLGRAVNLSFSNSPNIYLFKQGKTDKQQFRGRRMGEREIEKLKREKNRQARKKSGLRDKENPKDLRSLKNLSIVKDLS